MRWFLVLLVLLVAGCAAGCGAASCPEVATPIVAEPSAVAPEEPAPREAPAPSPPSGSIAVHPTQVTPSPGGGFVLLLADEEERRVLPVVIGDAEALVIDLRMRGERFPRPLTTS